MMMMNSSCIAGCLDAETPVKVNLVKLYQWAQADKEFLRMVSENKLERESSSSNSPIRSPVRRLPTNRHESYACSRQRYLRSYTFSRKETVSQRTKKWLKEKQKLKKLYYNNSKDSMSIVATLVSKYGA
ncbi:hypothetical protein F0562_006496 [Nyssa sinensis]|uniref:Uncharacterized protein n=1 Tax=Nyssa sinensis TaxID=561372 RepID=A0A5J5AQY7_9ASTE|nr:hypothetical protein F0562_006496 [Nyssa sinensis]